MLLGLSCLFYPLDSFPHLKSLKLEVARDCCFDGINQVAPRFKAAPFHSRMCLTVVAEGNRKRAIVHIPWSGDDFPYYLRSLRLEGVKFLMRFSPESDVEIFDDFLCGRFSQSRWLIFPKSVAGFPKVCGRFFSKSVADFPKVGFPQSQWLISLKSVTDFPKIGSGFPTEPEGTGGSLPYLCGLCERWKIWGRRFEDGKNSDG